MRTAERKMELQLTAPGAATWKRVSASGIELLAGLLRNVRHRIAANKLDEMDDWQLADIGLLRTDVTDAFETSLLEDPTLHLARSAQMRARSRFIGLRKN
ncbi:DUF1127 domain-containing protein [Agrobacterium larrymoorei]|uniref:DUF1127 domain-containing protein n=1 Tax=Agrobacterium larrymoorei TaxID=160699 RepID=UPI001572B31F|nr:DUF1127 domain-containing protein [Agrobacterium larrymoorei]NTJ41424.1 DUF1127 domain-containing protein [Agrobacterium larrymoorei]